MLQVFSGSQVRKDLSEEDLISLSDDLREVLADTLQHCLAAEAAEDRIAAARIAVRDMMQAYDATLAAFNAAHKSVSHAEALRAVIAAGQPGYKSPKASKASPEQDALDRASTDLANVRAQLTREQADYKTLCAKRSDAIMRWIAANPEKMTPDQLLRDHINAQQQQRIDIASGKVPAPQAQPVVCQSELDRVMSARGRRARVR